MRCAALRRKRQPGIMAAMNGRRLCSIAHARAALMKRGESVFGERNVTVRDLFVGDYVVSHHEVFLAEVAPLVASGQIKYREDIRYGIETVPAAFAEMLRAENVGKMLVQVSDDPTG